MTTVQCRDEISDETETILDSVENSRHDAQCRGPVVEKKWRERVPWTQLSEAITLLLVSGVYLHCRLSLKRPFPAR